MAIRIGALNSKDVFSNEAQTDAMFGALDRQAKAGAADDVTVYSEAFNGRKLGLVDEVCDEFRYRGYEPFCFQYNDEGEPDDKHAGLVTIRAELLTDVTGPEVIRLAGRNVLQATVRDPKTYVPVELVAAHFTAESGKKRRAMAKILKETVINPARQYGDSLVVAGVINSIPRGTPEGRNLRLALPLWPAMRLVAATPGRSPEKGIRRKASLGHRAISMAIDGVADWFDDEELYSVDPDRTPTVRNLRLDDIRVMGMTVLRQGVLERDVATDQDNLLPDSRKVWAVVQPTQR